MDILYEPKSEHQRQPHDCVLFALINFKSNEIKR